MQQAHSWNTKPTWCTVCRPPLLSVCSWEQAYLDACGGKRGDEQGEGIFVNQHFKQRVKHVIFIEILALYFTEWQCCSSSHTLYAQTCRILLSKQRINKHSSQFKPPLPFTHFLFNFICFQGKHRDNTPYGEYGGWYKACKVNRWGEYWWAHLAAWL